MRKAGQKLWIGLVLVALGLSSAGVAVQMVMAGAARPRSRGRHRLQLGSEDESGHDQAGCGRLAAAVDRMEILNGGRSAHGHQHH